MVVVVEGEDVGCEVPVEVTDPPGNNVIGEADDSVFEIVDVRVELRTDVGEDKVLLVRTRVSFEVWWLVAVWFLLVWLVDGGMNVPFEKVISNVDVSVTVTVLSVVELVVLFVLTDVEV